MMLSEGLRVVVTCYESSQFMHVASPSPDTGGYGNWGRPQMSCSSGFLPSTPFLPWAQTALEKSTGQAAGGSG